MHSLPVTTHGDAVGPSAKPAVPAANGEQKPEEQPDAPVTADVPEPTDPVELRQPDPDPAEKAADQDVPQEKPAGDPLFAAQAVEAPVPDDPPTALGELATALSGLRAAVGGASYPLVMPSADDARRTGAALVSQLDDYLLPRLARLDAPLLVVVGGSTGAGKSTLVNSLVRTPVSTAGVLRPTTRSPVLVSDPADLPWFRQGQLLPGLTRTTEPSSDPRAL